MCDTGCKPIFCRTAEAREGQNTHNTHQHEHGHKHKHKHKNNVNAISSEEILHVVLLQEPLSWMLQRLAAETRRSDLLTSQATTGSATLSSKHDHTQSNLPLLTEADDDNKLFTTWGKEYLRFLEISHDGDVKGAGRLRQLANECFESNVKDAHIEGGNIQAQYSNKNKTLLLKDSNTQQTTQRSRTKNTLHSSLVITTQLESILNRPNTIILIQEYVEESLQILNHVFGTSYFHLPSDTASSEQNHAAAAAVSVSSTSVGSPLAVKNTAAQLELHQLLYQETLRQFLRHYFAMTHIGA